MRLLWVIWMVLVISACTASATVEPTETATRAIPTQTRPPTATAVVNTPLGRGAILFARFEKEVGFACATCHYAERADRLIGPGMVGLAKRFEGYEVTGTLADYVQTAIMNPSIFHAPAQPAYPLNAMPVTYGEVFTPEQIDDLVVYVLSLDK